TKKHYELCSSRQQAVRLQVKLNSGFNIYCRRRACSRESAAFNQIVIVTLTTKKHYELCSSRQQAVRLQIKLNSGLIFIADAELARVKSAAFN
ncbi:hypothetical protein, partial [Pseudoalteromonas fuliginea]|uniref:hypothetical protein n=1 Tax=Pseudoalteromonas fuliginea TaxID=1872678 RepID=UPI000518A9E9